MKSRSFVSSISIRRSPLKDFLLKMSATAVETQEADLPKALIKRLVKAGLQEAESEGGADEKRDYQINKDALLAFSESGKLFIHYLTATANDICKEAKRQTISAEDVMRALTDMEFDEFVEPLKRSLDAYRAEMKEKNAKKKEEKSSNKKRKQTEGQEEAKRDGDKATQEGNEEEEESDSGEEDLPLDAEQEKRRKEK